MYLPNPGTGQFIPVIFQVDDDNRLPDVCYTVAEQIYDCTLQYRDECESTGANSSAKIIVVTIWYSTMHGAHCAVRNQQRFVKTAQQ